MFQKEKNSSSKPSIWFNLIRMFGGELSRVYISNFSTVQRHGFEQNHFPFSHGCLFLLGFQGSPQVRFATMERQHNALSDELWGDELSLAKVRVFWSEGFLFFWGGGGNFQQRFTKKQQGTNKNSVTIIGCLKVELMSLWKCQMGSAFWWKKLWQFLKVQGVKFFVFFCFCWTKEKKGSWHSLWPTPPPTKKTAWNLRLGGRCWGFLPVQLCADVKGRHRDVVFFSPQ